MGIFLGKDMISNVFFIVFEVISLIFVQFNLVTFWENGRKTDPLSLPLSVQVIQFNTHTLSLNSVQSVKSMQSSLMIILLQQDLYHCR